MENDIPVPPWPYKPLMNAITDGGYYPKVELPLPQLPTDTIERGAPGPARSVQLGSLTLEQNYLYRPGCLRVKLTMYEAKVLQTFMESPQKHFTEIAMAQASGVPEGEILTSFNRLNQALDKTVSILRDPEGSYYLQTPLASVAPE